MEEEEKAQQRSVPLSRDHQAPPASQGITKSSTRASQRRPAHAALETLRPLQEKPGFQEKLDSTGSEEGKIQVSNRSCSLSERKRSTRKMAAGTPARKWATSPELASDPNFTII